MENIRGTIEWVESRDGDLSSSSDENESILLCVVTDEGERVLVYAGPLWFLKQEGVELLPDDRVSIEGVRARTTAEGEILIPREIRSERGMKLVLFDEDGNPRWTTIRNDGH
jgi:hypothetical protein